MSSPSYERWLVETSRGCRSCPDCWDVPCGACQAGGVCDEVCHCGQREDYSADDRSGDDE